MDSVKSFIYSADTNVYYQSVVDGLAQMTLRKEHLLELCRERPILEQILVIGNDVWQAMLPYAVTLYWYIFFFLLATATVGRKLKLRILYIKVLSYLFDKATVKMNQKISEVKLKRGLSELEYESEDEDYCYSDSSNTSISDKASSESLFESSCQENPTNTSSGLTVNTSTTLALNSSCESLESSWESLCSQSNDANPSSKIRNSSNNNTKENNNTNTDILNYLTSQNDDNVKLRLRNTKASDHASSLSEDESNKSISARKNNSKLNGPSTLNNCSTDKIEPTSFLNANHDKRGNICNQEHNSNMRFPLDAHLLYLNVGIRAILDDCVNSSFSPEQFKTWNLLTR